MPKLSTHPRAAGRAHARSGASVRAEGGPTVEPETSGVPVSSGLVKPAGRAADVVAFEEAVISFFIEAADLIGAPKSVAAIYGICFASPEPLSFSEINERLDISAGSISQGLRVLREVGALKTAQPEKLKTGNAETEKLDELRDGADSKRAARYEPDLEMRKLLLQWIERRLQKQLNSGSSRLSEVLAALPARSDGSYDVLADRVDSLRTWHDKTKALLPIAKTFLKLT